VTAAPLASAADVAVPTMPLAAQESNGQLPALQPLQGSEMAQSVADDDVSSHVDARSLCGSLEDPQPEPASGYARQKPSRDLGFSFSYFESDLGMENVARSPTDTPNAFNFNEQLPARKSTDGDAVTQMHAKHNPWNPKLVGELEGEHEEVDDAGLQLAEEEDEDFVGGMPELAEGVGTSDCMFTPSSRLPRVPEQPEAANQEGVDCLPAGPHPTKRGAAWDNYGRPRPPRRPPTNPAHLQINHDYLEVEGATDRRVRTCSIAQKKNAVKAPSVSNVRKTGAHGPMMESLAGDGAAAAWGLASTMQGLGDPERLVEVVPSSCRFGPLRTGCIYCMSVSVRNLDVDVTRFSVVPLGNRMVRVKHSPGGIAPGMAMRLLIEIACLEPTSIEEVVEVRSKAQVVRFPVTARIHEAKEYDNLDAQALSVNGRRIREPAERKGRGGRELGTVELITDEDYCRSVIGPAYQALPWNRSDEGL